MYKALNRSSIEYPTADCRCTGAAVNQTRSLNPLNPKP